MELKLKDLLYNFKELKQQAAILKKCPDFSHDEKVQSDYHKKAFQLTVLTSAVNILNEKEKFVIEMHLIRQMSWPEVTKLYEERYGTADSRSERTLKRMQKKAITKMEDFIRSLQVGFNALI